MPTISPSKFKSKPGGSVPSSKEYNTADVDNVVVALTNSELGNPTSIVPKLRGVSQLIALSISPNKSTVNTLLLELVSDPCPNLVALIVN